MSNHKYYRRLLTDELGGSIPPRAAKINNMTGIKDEIAYLEYGKKYKELTPAQQREVDCEYDDLVHPY